MSKTITLKMARPSADEVESLWKLLHATEAVEDRWNRESSEQFLERLNDQDVSDEERAFIAIAWDSLVQGYGGFGRFIGTYETLIYNFQDPDADHVAIHPKFNALLAESALLPVVSEGYTDARNSIVEIENERNAALNTCTLIAEALGITGAVAGDTIARVQQLVGENAALKAFIADDCWVPDHEHPDLSFDCYCAAIALMPETPATTQALNEYIARSIAVPDGYQLCFVPLEQTTAFRDACTTAYEESLNGTGPCGVFMSGYRSMLSAAPKFAASLRGEHEIKS